MDHQKCEKHKGTVNCITVEFPVSNCPWCKKEKAEAERDRLLDVINTAVKYYHWTENPSAIELLIAALNHKEK